MTSFVAWLLSDHRAGEPTGDFNLVCGVYAPQKVEICIARMVAQETGLDNARISTLGLLTASPEPPDPQPPTPRFLRGDDGSVKNVIVASE